MSSKRNFTLALAAAVLVAACSGGKSPADGDANGAPKAVVLGFSQIGAESEWRTANTLSVQSAAKEAGVDLRFSDAQQKQENQISAMRACIQTTGSQKRPATESQPSSAFSLVSRSCRHFVTSSS